MITLSAFFGVAVFSCLGAIALRDAAQTRDRFSAMAAVVCFALAAVSWALGGETTNLAAWRECGYGRMSYDC